MTENAGIDPRIAAVEQETSGDEPAAPDQTMVAEDPAADPDGIGEPDELH